MLSNFELCCLFQHDCKHLIGFFQQACCLRCTDDEGATRRSGRRRWPVLEYWKGERVVYTEDGAKRAEVVGVLTPDLEENRKVGTTSFVQLPVPDTARAQCFHVEMQRARIKDSANGQRKPTKARKQVSMAKSVDAAASGDDAAEKVVAPGAWFSACVCVSY